MIEGSLVDVGLPGLLQFLATEAGKSYKVRLLNGNNRGELFLSEGELIYAAFGILEGDDALIELLAWREGGFIVDKLSSRFRETITPNMKLSMRLTNSFADQMAFLTEQGMGLNTEIVTSSRFGTAEWQAVLAKQPLTKDDFVVLGWAKEGRSMREAMREFQFDAVRATASLYRLVLTGSVEPCQKFAESLGLGTALGAQTSEELPLLNEASSDNMEGDIEQEKALKQSEKSAKEAKIKQELENKILSANPEGSAAQTFESLPALTAQDVEAHKKKAAVAVEPKPAGAFDIRRTDPLPLVAIDIERLFQVSLPLAPFGQIALNNDALDNDLKSILSDFREKKSLIEVATAKGRYPGQVLYTCKFSLERGYLEPPDAVVSLTIDLLLGRVELDQYLLQRRRMTGEELRELNEMSRQKGVRLIELFVQTGIITQSDLDRLNAERERFAPR